MIWRRYQNELLVTGALLLMFGMYLYKQQAISHKTGEANTVARTIDEIKEVVALQKLWADKTINKKVEKMKSLVSPSKVKWSQKGRKVTARYTELQPSELNKLVTKILNTPVAISTLDIQKKASSYTVEFKCRW